MMMYSRHAAALALVGWYLMLLPKNDPTVGVFSVSWSATQGSFDAAKDCEAARAKAVVPPSSPAAPSAKPDQRAYFCIATDDPRLKGTGVR
jgi:hypothetical protein